MDSRQQFEWWQCEAEDGPQVDPMWMMYDAETNTYCLDLIQSDWKTWQASRESLVLIIERRRGIYPDTDDYEAAIERAGLRTEYARETK